MKYLRAILFLTLCCLPALAAGTNDVVSPGAATPPAAGQLSLWQMAIVVLVPAIIAGVKLLLPRLPRWVLPLLAPLIGVALDQLGRMTLGTDSNGWLAMVLGGAGTGLREIGDQLKKIKPAP